MARSLQGESTFLRVCSAGLIRLTARYPPVRVLRRCPVTRLAIRGDSAELDDRSPVSVLELGDELVEITGGEPLLQPEVYPLMTRLADLGKTVLLETSGAVETGAVDLRVRIILDVKTPGSGEAASNVWANLEHLKPTDEVKFVVCDREDFDWSIEVIRSRRLTSICAVLVEPRHSVRSTSHRSWRSWSSNPAFRSGFNSSSTKYYGTRLRAGYESVPAICGRVRPDPLPGSLSVGEGRVVLNPFYTPGDLPAQHGTLADEVLEGEKYSDVAGYAEGHLRGVASDLVEIPSRG